MALKRRYFELYRLMGNISIDGFKRERYMLKVKDFAEEVAEAQAQLLEAELALEDAGVGDKLEDVARLLLRIETLEQGRRGLEEKLQLKEQKWIENDRLFKERRFALMQVLQLGLALRCDEAKALFHAETQRQRRLAQHEKALLLLSELFAENRQRSSEFLVRAEQVALEKQEELFDLKFSLSALAGAELAIE